MRKNLPIVILIAIALGALIGIFYNVSRDDSLENWPSSINHLIEKITSSLPFTNEEPESLDEVNIPIQFEDQYPDNDEPIQQGAAENSFTEITDPILLSRIQIACNNQMGTVGIDGRWYECQSALLGSPKSEPFIQDVTNEVEWNLMASDPAQQSITLGLTYDQWIAEGKPDPASRCAQPDYPAGIQTSDEQYQDKQTGEIIGETLMCYELMGISQEAWIQLKQGQ